LKTREISQAFLEEIPLIKNSLIYLKDTLRQKSFLMAELGMSVPEFEYYSPTGELNLSQLSSLLPFQMEHNHDLHKLLNKPNFREIKPAAALDEVLKNFHQEIEALDSYLRAYNISIYQRPLISNQRLILHHTYQVYWQGESESREAIIEIDRETHTVLNERPIATEIYGS
jgi:hypothetical protein